MATLTIRNIEDDIKSMLRLNAARHGWSMEEEVRKVLRQACRTPVSHNYTLATRNVRDFAAIDNLVLINPWQ